MQCKPQGGCLHRPAPIYGTDSHCSIYETMCRVHVHRQVEVARSRSHGQSSWLVQHPHALCYVGDKIKYLTSASCEIDSESDMAFAAFADRSSLLPNDIPLSPSRVKRAIISIIQLGFSSKSSSLLSVRKIGTSR